MAKKAKKAKAARKTRAVKCVSCGMPIRGKADTGRTKGYCVHCV